MILPQTIFFYSFWLLSAFMTTDNLFQVLLSQYRESLSNIRMRITIIWQLPSVSMATNTFFGIAYLGYAETFLARIMVLLASLSFTFVLMVVFSKNRFKLDASYDDFKWIQDKLLKSAKDKDGLREIKLLTKDIQKDPEQYPNVSRNWKTKQTATKWLEWSMYVTMLVIGVLLLVEIFTNR